MSYDLSNELINQVILEPLPYIYGYRPTYVCQRFFIDNETSFPNYQSIRDYYTTLSQQISPDEAYYQVLSKIREYADHFSTWQKWLKYKCVKALQVWINYPYRHKNPSPENLSARRRALSNDMFVHNIITLLPEEPLSWYNRNWRDHLEHIIKTWSDDPMIILLFKLEEKDIPQELKDLLRVWYLLERTLQYNIFIENEEETIANPMNDYNHTDNTDHMDNHTNNHTNNHTDHTGEDDDNEDDEGDEYERYTNLEDHQVEIPKDTTPFLVEMSVQPNTVSKKSEIRTPLKDIIYLL